MLSPFIRNRTEEFEHDVWSSYILPLYFNELGVNQVRKSLVLQGGRGCGKTSLLRYLSFQSQFSLERPYIPDDALKTIGLYLKADIQYYTAFDGCGISQDKWQRLFEHDLCLALTEQTLMSVLTLNATPERESKWGNIEKLNFQQALKGFNSEIPRGIFDCIAWVKLERQKLAMWLRNFDEHDIEKPFLLPLRQFLIAVIEELKKQLTYLKDSVFAIYIDEYENLLDYQQRFINTSIKAFEQPLIIHVAMKPNGMRTKDTTGGESIQETADFRLLDLDKLISPLFNLFCAELFFFRLINEKGIVQLQTPIKKEQLQDIDYIGFRSTDEKYRAEVIRLIKRILPSKTYKQIAGEIISKDREQAYNRWANIIKTGLKAKNAQQYTVEDFISHEYPEASIVCAALVNQKYKSIEEVVSQLNELKRTGSSKFIQADWIHHYLLGTLLLIYLPLRTTPSPIYTGFETFTKLSGTCVRYFLELCYLSINQLDPDQDLSDYSVEERAQSLAALTASRKFLEEISGCGRKANRLKSIVNFIGQLFMSYQSRASQSEPERTHFTIVGNLRDPQSQEILNEAVKWSVLLQAPETKVKANRFGSVDYILNPIYAPYFGLSYNKGRKVEFDPETAEIILTGDANAYSDLLKKEEAKENISEIGEQHSLDF